jgi:threonine/homoserine efflux transporter RhtA
MSLEPAAAICALIFLQEHLAFRDSSRCFVVIASVGSTLTLNHKPNLDIKKRFLFF